MKLNEQVLQVSSTGDGNWVPVARMAYVDVRDATRDDLIEVVQRNSDPRDRRVSVKLRGSGRRLMRVPKDLVRVKRLAGSTPITVVALCERIYNGIEANARRSVRRASRS